MLVYVLTALAVADLVLTRLRLAGDGGAGRAVVGARLLDVHSVLGAAAVVTWTVFLVAPADSPPGNALVGLIALALWWVAALAGLLILTRWLPSRGKHASEGRQDSWAEGPWLSVVAHVGLLAGVVFFTWAYATSAV